jgi:hypothetical protein
MCPPRFLLLAAGLALGTDPPGNGPQDEGRPDLARALRSAAGPAAIRGLAHDVRLVLGLAPLI